MTADAIAAATSLDWTKWTESSIHSVLGGARKKDKIPVKQEKVKREEEEGGEEEEKKESFSIHWLAAGCHQASVSQPFAAAQHCACHIYPCA